jgi:hypothetical protein
VAPIFSEETCDFHLRKPPSCQYFISPLPLNYYKHNITSFCNLIKVKPGIKQVMKTLSINT